MVTTTYLLITWNWVVNTYEKAEQEYYTNNKQSF